MIVVLKKIRRLKVILLFYFLIEIAIFVSAMYIEYFHPEIIPVWLLHYMDPGLIGVLLLLQFFSSIMMVRRYESILRQNIAHVSAVLGAEIKESHSISGLAIVSYNRDHEVIWTSELFEIRNIMIVGKRLFEWQPELKNLFGTSPLAEQEIRINNRYYSVTHIPSLKILYFKDKTEYQTLYQKHQNQAFVMMTMVLDNYRDVLSTASEEDTNELEINIRKTINEWAKENELVYRKIKEDTFLVLMQEVHYERIALGNFKLLDLIRKSTPEKLPILTMSIGIGKGTPEYSRLSELSLNAVDIALSRGGDQAVVNSYGKTMQFFGGRTENIARRTGVQERVKAQTFLTLLKSYSAIIIISHDTADLDALGASLGLLAIAKQMKKDAYIVMEEKRLEDKTRLALKATFTTGQIAETFVTYAKALEKLFDTTLLVVCDTNKPNLLMFPKILERAKNVAVIDHHRKAEDSIDAGVFEWIDTSASSTAEMVVDMLRYNDPKILLSNQYATFLLSGILLDTNNYRNRTTARTYEASALLKEFGAKNEVADGFLKDELEQYSLKAKIMASLQIELYGVAVVMAPEDQILSRAFLAQIAQEALLIKGIKSIFVIGYTEKGIVSISARSDGTINVQIIMEKMSGGGHYSSAATQLKDQTIDQARETLLGLLEMYKNDIRDDKGVNR